MRLQMLCTNFTQYKVKQLCAAVAAPGLGIWGGAFEGQHAFWGCKIEFHEISPPPRCQNF